MCLKAHLFSGSCPGSLGTVGCSPFVFLFLFFRRREGALTLSRGGETRVLWSWQVCVSFQMRHRGKRRVSGYSGHEGSFDLAWRFFSGTLERGSASPGLPPGGVLEGTRAREQVWEPASGAGPRAGVRQQQETTVTVRTALTAPSAGHPGAQAGAATTTCDASSEDFWRCF